jgi:lysophospholipase L1-like esterase
VRWVIVLHGVNDIGGASSASIAQNLIDAYAAFVSAARPRGVYVYGVPILPFGGSTYDSVIHEQARQAVNAWIRTPGNVDGLIDLEAAVQDPANPTRLLPVYDSGDHLHLSVAGYQRMAEAIDLAMFDW